MDAGHSQHASIFQNQLNRHGHPFQYAVIRRADDLHKQRESHWVFEVAEFPVEVRGAHTRIDFILSQRSSEASETPRRYLVAECKRANPALRSWVFAKAPYVRRGNSSDQILLESVKNSDDGPFTSPRAWRYSENIFHTAVEVRSSEKGDHGGSGRGAVEEAATQVLRGLNGLVECLARHSEDLPRNQAVTFVPAIFTTASIWTVCTDLASADLTEGSLEVKPDEVEEKPWLWFQYPSSPGILHEVKRYTPPEPPFDGGGLGRLLSAEYSRTIAIVGPKGIDSFLKHGEWVY